VHVEQVHADEQRSRAVDVNMRVVEAGQREGAFEIDEPGPVSRQPLNLRAGSHGRDTRPGDRDGFGPRPRYVQRVYASVDERHVDG
jgi:hypothetical protein